MTSTFTSNIQLEEPARGDDVGTWDTPVNANMTLIDKVAGAIATQSLNNSNIILSAAQFQSKQLTFNSTLTGSVSITFPTSFTKSYEIQNVCTGSSAFTITLQTTASGGQVIGCPPGETIDVFNDGTNLKFKNLGRIGSYWDYAGASVPLWVSACSVAPWLNCDGTSISSATFPQLVTILGTTTLPDRRGNAGFTLNQGTGRVTTAVAGLDGNTRFSVGGDQNFAAHSHSASGTTSQENVQHVHGTTAPNANTTTGGGAFPCAGPLVSPVNTAAESIAHTHTFSATTTQSGSGGSQNVPPACITGIVMIRAA